MRAHLNSLRAYYRWYRARGRWLMGQKRPPWTEEMVITWLMTFRIAPFEDTLPVLGRGAPCPGCRRLAEPHEPGVHSVFPGGAVWYCCKCGAKWLVLDSA